MFEGLYVDQVLMHDNTRAYPIMPQETSGVGLGAQAIYRYALMESDYPTLILVDPIYDNDRNVIPSGYYELALSDNKDFLILIQSKKAYAIIPVFRIQEDASEPTRLNDKHYKKELKKEAKARKETNEKRAKVGMPPDEEKVHMEASIEYNPNGNYYLIKYERGTIRAWGAIKK